MMLQAPGKTINKSFSGFNNSYCQGNTISHLQICFYVPTNDLALQFSLHYSQQTLLWLKEHSCMHGSFII